MPASDFPDPLPPVGQDEPAVPAEPTRAGLLGAIVSLALLGLSTLHAAAKGFWPEMAGR